MPALISRESSRLDKLAGWLLTSKRVDEEGFYGRFMRPLYRLAAMEVCCTAEQLKGSAVYEGFFSSVIGIIHPSDGHPQEEHTPDFGWFRPLSHNNNTWVLYWPDLEI